MIWVRFLELSLELYDEEVLYAIGNTVGCTVHIDGTTLAATREKYARICIEVDLAQPLLPFIIILGSLHNIEYEGLFMICFDYGKYGYKVADCPGKQKETAEVDSNQPMNLEKDTENNSDKWSYGPQMMPKYHRKKVFRKENSRRNAWVAIGNREMEETLLETGSRDQAPENSMQDPDLSIQTGSRINGKEKATISVLCQTRFEVLRDNEEDNGWENWLQALKAKVQAMPGPNEILKLGLAHEKGEVDPRGTKKIGLKLGGDRPRSRTQKQNGNIKGQFKLGRGTNWMERVNCSED